MAKTKWPKLPRFFVPLFHSANVYLCRSKEEWDQACIHLGVFNGDAATLVHECAHVAFYVCRDVGVTTYPGDANETYCYMLDRMFSHFLPFFHDPEKEGAK
ncbi:hypothetical protein D6P45_10345 [Salmonella enterica subsp. enterica serovar Manhattan]|nr:hypothetical protein [Salmonella enterica]EBY8073345.1 hypothetical protein [Salmonella enterica subsp. enterica serovar Manhattan]ECK3121635.1 hypothetical protein [Salmonella enterica]EDR7414485.1 hypothetical protein [Salmonella enterica subsp. enterica serovar Javiana]